MVSMEELHLFQQSRFKPLLLLLFTFTRYHDYGFIHMLYMMAHYSLELIIHLRDNPRSNME